MTLDPQQAVILIPSLEPDDRLPAYVAALRERGILVRRWDAPRIADWLRITVGSQAEMEALVRAVTEILKED